jgi:hypothetical protein
MLFLLLRWILFSPMSVIIRTVDWGIVAALLWLLERVVL